VDDASEAVTAEFLSAFAAANVGVLLIRHEQNRGYTASANAVLREGKADWIVLLNSDTVVPSAAFTKLVTNGEQFDRVGIVGPLSNAASWQTVPQLTGADGKFLVNALRDGMTVEDMDRLCEELSNGALLFAPLVNGFCYAVRRKLIERIGMFDEANFPQGYGEEDDFCLRAGEAGYLCGIATDTYVFHSKSASFTPERRKPLVEEGAKALRKKHSAERIQAATDMLRKNPELKRIRELLFERLN
jgi:GT2 family glycosyltransferase